MAVNIVCHWEQISCELGHKIPICQFKPCFVRFECFPAEILVADVYAFLLTVNTVRRVQCDQMTKLF